MVAKKPRIQADPASPLDTLYQQYRKLREIKGDGNCLFRALAYFAYGTEELHDTMRRLLVKFVKMNTEIFRPYVFHKTLEDHIDNMQHNRKWGTQVELIASASLFEMDVFILTDTYGATCSQYRWMKYSPIDPRKLTFPPADERPSDLDNINHMEFCHRLGVHFDCVVSYADGKLPLTKPNLLRMENTLTERNAPSQEHCS